MNMRRLAELPLFDGLDDGALREIGAAVSEESVEEAVRSSARATTRRT